VKKMTAAVHHSQALSTLQLCSGAESYIQALHLNPPMLKRFSPEKNTREQCIRSCVSRYAMPNTLSGLPGWFIFRITNIFMAILGKSEWQKARKVVHECVSSIAKTLVGQIGVSKDTSWVVEDMLKNVESHLVLFGNCAADKLLNRCLDVQSRPSSFKAADVQEQDLVKVMKGKLSSWPTLSA
jgi:hypothetical protein